MDLFICRYFCNTEEKVFELMELLVSERTNFNEKAQTFCQILTKKCEKENKNFNKEYPGIKKAFEEIAKTRNAFAHKLTAMPLKTEVGQHPLILREFKNKTANIKYTETEINEILERIETYSKMIKDMNNPK